jgi:glycosyltransferase involved in cell wall biosynthesis
MVDSCESELKNFPLVCICVPTYNAASTVRETLESILAQTYLNLVVHVSDNASTDDTLKVIESIADSRVTIHQHDVNVGGEGNFNRCIQFAKGKYTAIFHADDVYEPEMVAKQVAFLEGNSTVGAVFTAARIIGSTGIVSKVIGRIDASSRGNFVCDFLILFKTILKNGNFIVCPSAMVRTDIYKNEIQRWRGDMFRSSSDLDVWLRVAESHSIALLGEPLMRYRVDSNQFSNRVRLRTERADFFLVMDYYLGLQNMQQFLTEADQRNYRLLVNNDKVWRAINQFVMGNVSEARLLLRAGLNIDAVVASLSSRRDLLTLLVSLFVQLMIVLKLQKLGAAVLNYFRQKFNK